MPIRTILLIAILSTLLGGCPMQQTIFGSDETRPVIENDIENENAAPVAKAAEDETKPIIENDIENENAAPVAKAAEVLVYQGIVYGGRDNERVIICDDKSSAYLLRQARLDVSGRLSMPENCSQEEIAKFILFRENYYDGEQPLRHRYMSAFVQYIETDDWHRVYIEVGKKVALEKCENAPPDLQTDCRKNIVVFENNEGKKKRRSLGGTTVQRAPDSIKEKAKN